MTGELYTDADLDAVRNMLRSTLPKRSLIICLSCVVSANILPDDVDAQLKKSMDHVNKKDARNAELDQILRGEIPIGGLPAGFVEKEPFRYDGLRPDFEKRLLYIDPVHFNIETKP